LFDIEHKKILSKENISFGYISSKNYNMVERNAGGKSSFGTVVCTKPKLYSVERILSYKHPRASLNIILGLYCEIAICTVNYSYVSFDSHFRRQALWEETNLWNCNGIEIRIGI